MRFRRGSTSAGPAADQVLLRRTGRVAALQAALALAVVLMLIGAVAFLFDIHVQNKEISGQLSAVVASADDVTDAPPGTALAIRAPSGNVAVSDHAPAATERLLDAPPGYSDVRDGGSEYRALVADRDGTRVVALLDLTPWQTGRQRLLIALAAAEIAGVIGATVVVVMLSKRAIRPLATALSLQRRFVADASHELRAPLTLLHTRAQLAARRADQQGVDEKLREHLHGLVADTRTLGEVVEDLLLVASLESGIGVPGQERVDPIALCEDVRAGAAAYAESLGIGLDIEAPLRENAAIIGSRSALRRALIALIDNALAHEKPGGRVLLRVHQDTKSVSVSVTDTGVGLDPHTTEQLFTRFAHGDGHTAGVRHYGIGLALVREIVTAHRGHITVGGAPGRGATFTLTFPAAPA
ncbi:sensor histidine kinase [Rhodococcus sp. NPDC056960]|uniref:sensor histidine kinase n=1 Tax=Rhodococcus sp. NPDC056960 TaxID=3345982 RepID=UPI003634B863